MFSMASQTLKTASMVARVVASCCLFSLFVAIDRYVFSCQPHAMAEISPVRYRNMEFACTVSWFLVKVHKPLIASPKSFTTFLLRRVPIRLDDSGGCSLLHSTDSHRKSLVVLSKNLGITPKSEEKSRSHDSRWHKHTNCPSWSHQKCLIRRSFTGLPTSLARTGGQFKNFVFDSIDQKSEWQISGTKFKSKSTPHNFVSTNKQSMKP